MSEFLITPEAICERSLAGAMLFSMDLNVIYKQVLAFLIFVSHVYAKY